MVLSCVNCGLNNAEIAVELSISRSTVKNCIARLSEKTGLRRARLIVLGEFVRSQGSQ